VKALSLRLKRSSGLSPVTPPWPSLARVVQPRAGNLILALGAPGVGKSTFAMEWAISLAERGLGVLYLSFDTPLHDQATRVAARLFNEDVRAVAANPAKYAAQMAQRDLTLRFSDVSLDPSELAGLIAAERLWFGDNPAMVVLDNAGDMLHSDDISEWSRLFNTLRDQALRSGTTFLALHHVKRGEAATGKVAPKMADGVYGGERPSQIILGLWRPFEDEMNIAVLKNRMGPASPSGSLFVSLGADMARSCLYEKEAPSEDSGNAAG
jgi:hypothetical protein